MIDRLMKLADQTAASLSRRGFFRKMGQSALPVAGVIAAWLSLGKTVHAAQTVNACKYLCLANSKEKWFCSTGGCPVTPGNGQFGCKGNWLYLGRFTSSCTCKEGVTDKKCCNACIKAVKKSRGEPDDESVEPTVI